jgi:type II secretory pathway pseudopilin PulG
MRGHRGDAGFSLAALIFFASAASIFIAAVVPAYQMQAKREMEEELIFRGEEYMRAIQKYQRRFGVYPSTVDQLISTNGLRFLRKPYKDPTSDKEFRLITVNPDGSLNGSKVYMQNMGGQPLFGGNIQTFGQPQQQNSQGQNPQQQMQQQMQQRAQQQQTQQRGFPSAGGQQQQGFPAAGQQGQIGQPIQGGQRPQPGLPGGGVNAGGQTFAAGGIIGVASNNEKESIKVYNTRQKYDEWEFIAIMGQQGQPGPGGQPGGQPGQQGQPGLQQPGQQPQNSPFNQGGPRQNNPFQNMPQGNPFGGPPANSAFGPLGGQQQPPIQNPFGFGGPQQPQQQQPLPGQRR